MTHQKHSMSSSHREPPHTHSFLSETNLAWVNPRLLPLPYWTWLPCCSRDPRTRIFFIDNLGRTWRMVGCLQGARPSRELRAAKGTLCPCHSHDIFYLISFLVLLGYFIISTPFIIFKKVLQNIRFFSNLKIFGK